MMGLGAKVKEGTVLRHPRQEAEEALERLEIALAEFDDDLVDVDLAVVLQPTLKVLAWGRIKFVI